MIPEACRCDEVGNELAPFGVDMKEIMSVHLFDITADDGGYKCRCPAALICG